MPSVLPSEGDYGFAGLADEGRDAACRILVQIRRVREEILPWLVRLHDGKPEEHDSHRAAYGIQHDFLQECIEKINEDAVVIIDDLLCVHDCSDRLHNDLENAKGVQS